MVKKLVLLGLILITILLAVTIEDKRSPLVLKNKCVGCGDCIEACPVEAIELKKGKATIDNQICINCGICFKTCTYSAIRSENE